MPLPRIAIVGRPNVGKSSLLNRLAKERVSIVDPTPGVTRDRVTTVVEIRPPLDAPKAAPNRLVELMDTGGYGVYVAEGARYDDVGADLATLTDDIETQIQTALDDADLILFVIDAQAGITSLDETVARLLRSSGQANKVMMVANKVDGESWEAHGLEGAGLGLGEPALISAQSGFNTRKFLERLYGEIPFPDDESVESDPEMKIAFVGKRNSGKSTMINALAGEPRVIVSEIAGTTRDSVDVRFEVDGHMMTAIDTAGLRKRKSFSSAIEVYATDRMNRAIDRADVVMLLIDATQDISQVDQTLSKTLQEKYKPTVIVITKIDLVDQNKVSPEDYVEYITQELPGLEFAPVVFVCAEEHEGLYEMMTMAHNLFQQANHRESTGALNQVVEEILQKRGPTSRLGSQAKLYFASQVDVRPPTIVLKVNKPELFKGNYERYLMNRLREALPYSEVPIKLIFSSRARMDLQDLKQQGRGRQLDEAEENIEG
ncbi:MAG: ribosome biogenesis GTPase Der [Planctomycetota bacterium]